MRLRIANVRVVDGIGDEPLAGRDVVVEGERIAAVTHHRGSDDGAAETVVDGRGLTLLPGFVDAHAHYTFDPSEGSLQAIARRSDEAILAAAEGHARLAVEAGVTTARGAGSIRGLERVLRDRIADGSAAGPRMLASGTAVGAPNGHGIAFGVGATGPRELAEATRRVIEAGADVVKVVASEAAMLTTTGHEPGRDVFGRPELSLDELRAIVDVAHGRGRRVMAHAQGSESVVRCALAGVDSVEHAWLADADAIAAIAESGAFLVPTLVVTDVNRTLGGLDPVQRARQDLIEERHRAATEHAVRLGVPLATGTDTGEVGVTADMVAREVVLLHGHGLAPAAAIRAATSGAARLLGIDGDTGTIEAGKRADLVLVRGDPLADLSLLARPAVVVAAGRPMLGLG